jgi:hypothetical protein
MEPQQPCVFELHVAEPDRWRASRQIEVELALFGIVGVPCTVSIGPAFEPRRWLGGLHVLGVLGSLGARPRAPSELPTGWQKGVPPRLEVLTCVHAEPAVCGRCCV